MRHVERVTRAAGRFADWVSGACLLVRRRDADAVGLLDERYFMYPEDVDFCAAIRARGRRILFVPAARSSHLRGRSARDRAASQRGLPAEPLAFYAKHHPRWWRRSLRPDLRL